MGIPKAWVITKRHLTDSVQVIGSLKNPNLFQTQGYINGRYVDSSSTQTFDVNNPASFPDPKSYIGTVQSMTADDFNTAVGHAETAFKTFRKTTAEYRSDLLRSLYNSYIKNQDDLAKLIVLENGKPYADALGEVKYAASFFKWYADIATTKTGDIINSTGTNKRILSLKQPIGVCGIMTPWNFPAAMITRKLAAYVAAGCTGVIKPASETPFSALAMGHLQEQAGFPKGVINILPSSNAAEVGKLLCEHPGIKKVSFTGSTNVGKLLMSQSASTLKKLSFELGGNAPLIVFNDVDIDSAVDGAIASKFRSSGQTCICANRIFVHESIYDEFSEKFASKLEASVTLGDGLDQGVTHGPVIHERSFAKVRSHIEDAVSKGAKIISGGNPRPDLGVNFHELTILAGVTSDMLITQEETFGPVCPLIKFSSEEEVLAMANDTDVGLAGYFFTNDIRRAFRVAEELEVGMIGVNTGAISEAALPFGGIKASGFGREGSIYGVDDYMVVKSMVIGL
ncbi:succinic semialdehyde dehydrogenase [Yamadazyma tenuis ATCC 10573]|uniref:Succinate-semialdehyde dehydrogenase n=2 Tax=Candida tenuis TaxID=2315449 RepID=G3AZF6_CANTC|nr:succinic semialdehyde dehydrogenase [Yamadazyma tenuis ATCC 10573]EGV66083.1 succinic semialdehyde dehydrogenase [Yamadazyma tenuis ATCC 10573]